MYNDNVNHWMAQTQLFARLSVLFLGIKIGCSFSRLTLCPLFEIPEPLSFDDKFEEIFCLRCDRGKSSSSDSSLVKDLQLEKCFLTRYNRWLKFEAISSADDLLVTDKACQMKMNRKRSCWESIVKPQLIHLHNLPGASHGAGELFFHRASRSHHQVLVFSAL